MINRERENPVINSEGERANHFVHFPLNTYTDKMKIFNERKLLVESKYGSQLNVNRPDILVDVSPVRRKHCEFENVTGIYEAVDNNIYIKEFVFGNRKVWTLFWK